MTRDAPAIASTAPTASTLDAQVLADQVAALQRTLPSILLGNTVLPCLVLIVLYGIVSTPLLLTWFGLQMLHSAVNGWGWYRTRKRPATPRSAPRRARAAIVLSALSGLMWGACLVLLWPHDRLDLQVFVIFLLGGMINSALHALAALPMAYRVFMLPCVASVVGMSVWAGTAIHLALAASVVVYGLTCLYFAAGLSRALRDSLRDRYMIASLAADLQQQKERAEIASRDKSRFLAAASHDLRQPVHALSLFLAALRRQPMTREGARLAANASEAVETMSDLFGALLDVSKLDAGTVRPEPRPFALVPLLQRVTEQEREAAAARGLQLRLRLPAAAEGPWFETDPVLLERVLRNLVSNAVRYTDRGRVLLALRRGAGGWVIQVRDSGIGIPAERHADVFDEFVQLHNPERDRHKGLGLGLAIVRRTAGLLGLPLWLRSAPGRGTTFTLGLPRALPPGRHTPTLAAPAPSAPVLQGLRVVVIDDDDGILAAMAAVLADWGCEVVAAGADVAALLPVLSGRADVPELIVSDFRLRGDDSGIDAVARLRDEYNHDIPAILITGDTASERLLEAQSSGLMLLHKPVSADELRTAVARVLAGRDALLRTADGDEAWA